MKRMLRFACAGITLLGLVIWGCSKTSASTDSLAGVSDALAIPQLGGATARGAAALMETDSLLDEAASRIQGKACLHGINGWRRLKSLFFRGKRHLCQFGKLQDAGVVAIPATGYNYYKFTFSNAETRDASDRGLDLRMRIGIKEGGNLASFCVGTSKASEVHVVKGAETVTVKVTDTHLLEGASTRDTTGTHQTIVTGAIGETAITFSSATAQTFGGTFKGSFSLTNGTAAGGFNEMKHYYERAARSPFTHRIYTQFNTTASCTKFSDGTATLTHSCTNDASSTCATSAPACQTPVAAFDLATITGPTAAPTKVDAWDCTAPTGITFTEINFPSQSATVKRAIRACHTEHGGSGSDRSDSLTEENADAGGTCS